MLKELGEGPRHPAARDQRLPLPDPRGRARPRGAALHPDREDAERPRALEVRHRPALREGHRGPARSVRGRPRGDREHAAGREALRPRAQEPRLRVPGLQVPTRARPSSSASTRRRAPGSRSAWRRAAASANGPITGDAAKPYWERLEFELASINKLQFAGYFLIVSDFINWAKRQAIPVGPGRGSAAGIARRVRAPHHRPRSAAVQAALRALPEPRAQVDARHRRRLLLRAPRRGDPLRPREVRRGPRRRHHHVRDAQGKAAIKDVGRVLEFSYGETDTMAKLYPAPVQGKDHPLAEGARDRAEAPRDARPRHRPRARALRLRLPPRRAHAPRLAATPPASSSPTDRSRSTCRSSSTRKARCSRSTR